MPFSTHDFDAHSNKCFLCNSQDIFHFKTDYRGVNIFKCRNCNIRFLNPLYSDKWLYETYTDYKEHNPDRIDKSILISRGIKHEFNIKQIEEYTGNGRFFSVGCGNGVEIMVAKKRGWIAEGYEISPEWAKQLSKLHSANIYSGDFIKLPLKKGYYDCLYVNHVIEHLKEPHNYIKKIYDILKPGGILYIGTPNINGLANRIKGFTDSLNLRKNTGKYYGTKQHLFYYTPASLKFLLEKYYNFKVLLMNNDLKLNNRTKKVSRNLFDRLCYKTSFRLLAKKV